MKKLVRFAFKVSASAPRLTQEQWESVLLAAGADLRTVRRIIFFAPNTAARVYLSDQDVTFLSNDYTIYGPAGETKRLPLSAEPVFEECLREAKQCSLVQLLRMYERSATANSVSAHRKGARLQVGSTMIASAWLCPSDETVASAVPTAKLSLKQRLQLLFS